MPNDVLAHLAELNLRDHLAEESGDPLDRLIANLARVRYDFACATVLHNERKRGGSNGE